MSNVSTQGSDVTSQALELCEKWALKHYRRVLMAVSPPSQVVTTYYVAMVTVRSRHCSFTVAKSVSPSLPPLSLPSWVGCHLNLTAVVLMFVGLYILLWYCSG